MCAALLFHAATIEELNLVLQLLPKGAFLWELVSLKSWSRAIQSIFVDRESESHALDCNGIRILMERILDRPSIANSSWHIVLALILEALNIPRDVWPRGCTDLPARMDQRKTMSSILLKKHYQEFRQRHAAAEEAGENAWPRRACPGMQTAALENEISSHAYEGEKSYHKTVLQAPSLAAWMFLNSKAAPTFEQRAWFVRMHGIDPVWFQGAFACALLSMSAISSRP
jgi:hypothetical protein